jgi:protein subunit release factor A
MIGAAERSEKFRNYNFRENRVTDARLKIKITDKIESIMEGNLEEICQKSFDYQIEKTLVKLVS